MRLSKHFTLTELTRSATAQRLGLDNSPTVHELANLMRLAAVLEDVRHVLGSRPILISSGFRSEAVNKAVGGSTSSAHRLGLAADFTCPDFGSPLMVCKAIASSGIQFDQLIHEKGSWVHLGLSHSVPRTQLLTYDGTRYLPGLQPVTR
ncbi:peptidase M15 [Bordetella genomosp. 7]|uniref:D-Ala-D-Ala carboxypeptidase family metallohydrolase n=1 Tax=Bordetella genomosp. 7 TaxID=1416805 RepID=UPI000B9E278F|nr:D-Ala-D-Ala carboxypeptidase family metallohydrolase [Bordetella genomosp. 7]OZI27992.1 peptidase M15 [Bordetella genomosp. 7]